MKEKRKRRVPQYVDILEKRAELEGIRLESYFQ